jgi:hypothetical protein
MLIRYTLVVEGFACQPLAATLLGTGLWDGERRWRSPFKSHSFRLYKVKRVSGETLFTLAEGVRFELTVPLPARRFSRPFP